jgi:hypothetical protein
MIPQSINNQSCFFSVARITKEYPDRLVYTISLNNKAYYLSKTIGINDCQQLDANLKLENELFNELCEILTEIELEYQRNPSTDFINQQIFKILGRIRATRFKSEHD